MTGPVAAKVAYACRASRAVLRHVVRCACITAVAACGGNGAPEPAADGSDPALTALADTLLPALERLSRLQARGPLVIARRDARQVTAFVEQQMEEELPPEELEAVRQTYALLGLLPDTLDLRALLLALYTEQIVGYYDPDEKKLFVVEGVPAEAVRPVVAHELVHALQDQHTDLDSLIARERGNDRQSAAQAAIEGHATLVMFAVLAEEAGAGPVDPALLPNLAEQLRAGLEQSGGPFPVFRSAPRIIRETLLFPYVEGARFVQALWRAQPDSARTAPIGPLLPQSTEQVLEPDTRFIDARDDPTELRFAANDALPPGGPSAGWDVVYENTMGRLETGIFLQEHLGMAADNAAIGWDGDRYRLLRAQDGDTALEWYTIWDDDAAAQHFEAHVERVLGSGRLEHAGSVTRLVMDQRLVVRVTLAPRGHMDAVPRGRIVIAPAASTGH